jgi:flagellar protein FliO/FliZ
MKCSRLSLAAMAACVGVLSHVSSALAARDDRTPLKLPSASPKRAAEATGSGGGLVRTIVGLAIVIGVIYGLYWILRQVKSSKEGKATGYGLSSVASLPLGPNRSLHMVRAGREMVLVGSGENGVTPIRAFSLDELEAAGLLDPPPESHDDGPPPPAGGFPSVRDALVTGIEAIRKRTVRQ